MSRMWLRRSSTVVLAGLACLLGLSGSAFGVKMIPKGISGGADVPINVTAERMEADHRSKKILFRGNVVTTRGPMILRSETLEVFTTDMEGGVDEVQRVLARGNVRFEHEAKRATGDEAVYLAQEGTVVLTGNTRAWDGENEVRGHRMTLYIEEDKSVVTGGADRRVEVTLKPRGTNRQRFPSPAARNGNASQGPETPIYVTADRMEADHKQRTVFFEGKVIARQADFRMDSDELEVFDSAQGDRQLSRIVARGNVRLDRGGKIATGDKAVYYESDRKFLLTGHARAREKDNIITGTRMEIFIDEDKSVVLGDGKEQVEVTIYPQGGAGVAKQPLPLPTASEGGAEAPSRP
jgi:lipopolysaccharide export system protein LptA